MMPENLLPCCVEAFCSTILPRLTNPSGSVVLALSRNFIVGNTRLSVVNAFGGTSIRCVRPETVARLSAALDSLPTAPDAVVAKREEEEEEVEKVAGVPSASDDTRPGTEFLSDRFRESSNGFKRRLEDFASVSENLKKLFLGSLIGLPDRNVSFILATGERDEDEEP